MEKKRSNLVTRVLTAIVAIPLLLAIIFMAPPWGTFLLVAFAGMASVWEYCSITYGDENRLAKVVSVLVAAGISAVLYFVSEWFVEATAVAFLLIFIVFLFSYDDQERVSHQIGSSITGILYGGVVLTTLSLLVRDAGIAGPYWILMAMGVTWGSDTGAYFAGRAFGKHKLYEAVSPNKTIEGSLGGIAASIGFGFLFNYLFSFDAAWTSLEVWQVLVMAIPANILAQLGDLSESLIKRAHGIKDSGNILPGHGGMLDRIDGLIFASPWFYIFFTHFVL
ncbi:phosphatidate cytidylyltransferase [Persicimonas caeni]|uniref:Phosphatidate cytidylyltransferase n=1 Tax=Persicimonas caeni TaxID=2292766 RepID=A0A4Y6PQ51_PERCE|nr:phosphatidate cytidylyltransferase [Persicimonas caeni]QDG49885.1 phosphatidate cytidylyltransferase [Persicimonas caeni]QED31106.1 phosphatidate cytidylyltransferase [Persicimonas caeni]